MKTHKDRRKKAGRNKGKKVRAMRRSEAKRKANAKPRRRSTDHPDEIMFKPGAADDKNTRRGAR